MNTYYDRIISIDTGLNNVGVSIMDADQNVLYMETTPLSLDNSNVLQWKKFIYKVDWIGRLTDLIYQWLGRYIIPRILHAPEHKNLIIIEENSIPFTKDFPGIISAFFYRYDNITIMTVSPIIVHRSLRSLGMPKGLIGKDKKKWVINHFGEKTVNKILGDLENMNITEHSCDAWMNATYFLKRYKINKK